MPEGTAGLDPQVGLVTSFLKSFQAVSDMQQRQQQMQQQAAQQAVQNAMEKERIRLEQERATTEAGRAKETARHNVEMEQGLGEYRQQMIGVAKDRLGLSTDRLDLSARTAVMNLQGRLFQGFLQGGLDEDTANVMSMMRADEMAQGLLATLKKPTSADDKRPAFKSLDEAMAAVAQGASPQVTLHSGLPSLPATDSLIKGRQAGTRFTEARTQQLEDSQAFLASEHAAKLEYEKLRNKKLAEDIKGIPLDRLKKQLGIDTERLRQSILQHQIDLFPLDQAIKQAELAQKRRDPLAATKMATVREVLKQSLSINEGEYRHWESEVTRLKAGRPKDSQAVEYFKGLEKKGQLSAEDFATYSAVRQKLAERDTLIADYEKRRQAAEHARNEVSQRQKAFANLSQQQVTPFGGIAPWPVNQGLLRGITVPPAPAAKPKVKPRAKYRYVPGKGLVEQ